ATIAAIISPLNRSTIKLWMSCGRKASLMTKRTRSRGSIMTADYSDQVGGFKVPLYSLFHIKDIRSHPRLDEKDLEALLGKYGPDKMRIVLVGLEWAVQNRDFDFKGVFPGMRHSNEEILQYFD